MSCIGEDVTSCIFHPRIALCGSKGESRGTCNFNHIVARNVIVGIKISKRDINM
jgi:hypothetical protein